MITPRWSYNKENDALLIDGEKTEIDYRVLFTQVKKEFPVLKHFILSWQVSYGISFFEGIGSALRESPMNCDLQLALMKIGEYCVLQQITRGITKQSDIYVRVLKLTGNTK